MKCKLEADEDRVEGRLKSLKSKDTVLQDDG
jgi:hypothetical protein